MSGVLSLVIVGSTVILAEFCSEATAKLHRTNEKEFVPQSKERRNRDELTRIIKVLNGDPGFDNNYERNNNQGARNHIDKETNENVLQKKYIKKYDYESSEAEVRLHFIKNPEVLDRYVKKLRKDTSTSSSSSDSSDEDRRYAEDAADIRRNAMFRVQEASNENKDDPLKEVVDNKIHEENAVSFPPSIEDQVTPFKTHFVQDQNDANKKDQNVNFDDVTTNTKRYKIKSKRNKIKEKTTTESWDLGDTYDNVDGNVKSKEKANLWDKTEKVKHDKVKNVKKTNNDPWDISSKKVKDRTQSKEKSNNDEWDKPAKRKENKFKNEDDWGKPVKKKSREDKFESEKKIKNNEWDKPRNKKPNARYEDVAPKSNKNNKYDKDNEKKETKNKNGNEPEKPVKQSRNKSFKDSKTYKDLWDSRDIEWKKKKSNSFEDVEPKKKTTKKWIEPVKKKVDWDAPRNIKDNIDNDWDKVGRDWGKKKKLSHFTEKTTRGSYRQKKKMQNDYDRPSYVARIPEYHHKSYKSRIDVGGTFRGRTPIPFVGKRGIYDDK